MEEKDRPVYGGQAVVEGVMFGGKKQMVTAIRRKDGSLNYYYLPREEGSWRKKYKIAQLKKIPFLRGLVAIVEASAMGSKHLNFSTERYDLDPSEDEQIEEQPVSKLSMWLGVAAVGVLSLLLSKFLFTIIPVFLAEFTRPIFPSDFAQIIVESSFKLILLLFYIYMISLTPLIRRVFQYHGAEHKVINCFENGKELTVENVQAHSRLHYRCGSSFILFTVIVGMFVYFLVPTDPLWLRIVDRLALIPVVIGIAFEVLQITNKLRDIPVLKWFGVPGLWLQLLTTKEPKDDQVEVAIASFTELLKLEAPKKDELAKEELA